MELVGGTTALELLDAREGDRREARAGQGQNAGVGPIELPMGRQVQGDEGRIPAERRIDGRDVGEGAGVDPAHGDGDIQNRVVTTGIGERERDGAGVGRFDRQDRSDQLYTRGHRAATIALWRGERDPFAETDRRVHDRQRRVVIEPENVPDLVHQDGAQIDQAVSVARSVGRQPTETEVQRELGVVLRRGIHEPAAAGRVEVERDVGAVGGADSATA